MRDLGRLIGPESVENYFGISKGTLSYRHSFQADFPMGNDGGQPHPSDPSLDKPSQSLMDLGGEQACRFAFQSLIDGSRLFHIVTSCASHPLLFR